MTAPDHQAQAHEGRADRWMPIETAPKDGTPVLVACCRTGSIRWAVWSESAWRDGHWNAGGLICGVPNPTHWRPLPAPPAPSQGEGRR